MRRRLALAVLLVAITAQPVSAQAPSCEDTLRVMRTLAEQYVASRSRTEIEAAQTIVGLQKRIEALRTEIEVMRAAREEKR